MMGVRSLGTVPPCFGAEGGPGPEFGRPSHPAESDICKLVL